MVHEEKEELTATEIGEYRGTKPKSGHWFVEQAKQKYGLSHVGANAKGELLYAKADVDDVIEQMKARGGQGWRKGKRTERRDNAE